MIQFLARLREHSEKTFLIFFGFKSVLTLILHSTAVTCDPCTAIDSGSVSATSTGYEVGSMCHYSCDKGD